jgi:hypothetical protein
MHSMSDKTFRDIWREITPEQKKELARRADSSYDYLKLIAHRNGRCGRHLAKDIARGMKSMRIIEGDIAGAVATIFPRFASSNEAAA